MKTINGMLLYNTIGHTSFGSIFDLLCGSRGHWKKRCLNAKL